MKKFIIILLVINLVIILFFWFYHSGQLLLSGVSDLLLSLGRLWGLLMTFTILLQFLVIGRTPWLESVYGLDNLSRFHHLLSRLVFVLLISHPIFITFAAAASSRVSYVTQLQSYLNDPDISRAGLSLVIFLLVIILSLYFVRVKIKYEFWYFLHLLVYIAVILAWGHQLSRGGDFQIQPLFAAYWYLLYIFVFAHLLIFRFIRPLFLFFTHRFYISRIAVESEDVVSLYISTRHHKLPRIIPGQFAFFRFLTPGFWWQSHPFSFSGFISSTTFRITVKKLGDFSGQLSRLKIGDFVFFDGPYGIFTANHLRSSRALLIAGGIGITPIRSVLESLVVAKKLPILIYSYRDKSSPVFKSEITKFSSRYSFPVFYRPGHFNPQQISSLVPDYKNRDIFLCGPSGFMVSIVDYLTKQGLPRDQIHYERFCL